MRGCDFFKTKVKEAKPTPNTELNIEPRKIFMVTDKQIIRLFEIQQ